MTKSVYTAGPMTGYPSFNFPAFFAADRRLTEQGWKVWNPAAKDAEAKVHEMEAYKTGDAVASIKEGFDFRAAFMWDCEKVIYSNGIYLLKGWEKSTGARGEWAVAQFIKANDPSYEIMYEV